MKRRLLAWSSDPAHAARRETVTDQELYRTALACVAFAKVALDIDEQHLLTGADRSRIKHTLLVDSAHSVAVVHVLDKLDKVGPTGSLAPIARVEDTVGIVFGLAE